MARSRRVSGREDARASRVGATTAAAQAAKQAKDEGRLGLTAAIRPLVRRLQASSVVSNAERESLGITVANEPSPLGPATT